MKVDDGGTVTPGPGWGGEYWCAKIPADFGGG